MKDKTKTAAQVATAINAKIAKAAAICGNPENEIYVRIPGIGARAVRRIRLDEDLFVTLDLDWAEDDDRRQVRLP